LSKVLEESSIWCKDKQRRRESYVSNDECYCIINDNGIEWRKMKYNNISLFGFEK
jgi:hypothetical protein